MSYTVSTLLLRNLDDVFGQIDPLLPQRLISRRAFEQPTQQMKRAERAD